nr:MAG TPA: hypothetical protein [Bacteriophage sp.]
MPGQAPLRGLPEELRGVPGVRGPAAGECTKSVCGIFDCREKKYVPRGLEKHPAREKP